MGVRRWWPRLLLLGLLLASLAGGWWLWSQRPAWRDQALASLGMVRAAPPDAGIGGSGAIEATTVAVMAEMAGPLHEVAADQGDDVRAGQVLARLDATLLDAQLRQAQARLRAMEAALALTQAGARPEEIAQAEAAVEQARTAVRAAQQLWENAVALRDNQQDLDVEIAAVQGQLAVARQQASAAEAAAQATQGEEELLGSIVGMLQDGYDVAVPLPGGGYTTTHVSAPAHRVQEAQFQWNLASQRAWQMWKGLDAARAAVEGYGSSLSHLRGQAADPLVQEAEVRAAKANIALAEAAQAEAESALAALKEGATAQQAAVAEAQVAEARAALRVLEAQRQKSLVTAPVDGLVLERPVRTGETVAAGARLFRLAHLDTVYLTVYVAATEIGKVRLGQAASVTVDSFPGRVFQGRVTHIASEAEFTPKNVQTEAERVYMVFAVKVDLPNPDHALKPGMPADARLHTDGAPLEVQP
ncbi:MAG: HlyD family efflux transporter periplasmic adaptor subunit [Chloroflexi bacterium]|nr:HlyD family efflux transporter periplasmic adaptor subunit [Chloroflexota bacterium]